MWSAIHSASILSVARGEHFDRPTDRQFPRNAPIELIIWGELRNEIPVRFSPASRLGLRRITVLPYCRAAHRRYV